MLWLAFRGLTSRRTGSLLAAAGLATATIGFVLLAGTTRTTEVVVQGDIARAWGGPYQLLVRPPGAAAELEERDGLVRPNAISGLTGGITRGQLQAIKAIGGVDVAAPIAVVGFVQWPAGVPLDLTSAVASGGLQVFRISTSARGEADLSRYPVQVSGYLVVAPAGRVTVTGGRAVLQVGDRQIVCDPPVTCFGGETPDALPVRGIKTGTPGFFVSFPEPFVIAGIDPGAEAALVGLDRCVSQGRYLRASDQPVEASSPVGRQPAIPVLVSDRSFIDERLSISVERASNAEVLLGGNLDGLSGWQLVEAQTATANDAYRAFLPTLARGSFYDASPLWSVGDVGYETLGVDHLRALTRAADPSVYDSAVTVRPGAAPGLAAPAEARDVWFRDVVRHDQQRRSELFSRWDLVGQFDPSCVPGFDRLAGGTLETYSLPAVLLPDGRQLGPTRSPASYVTSPPLVLVTLDTAAWFADPARYAGRPGAAFISAVRVRVAGTDSPSPAAEDRLARVAADIHDATGLRVDIVAGSSPRQVSVDLPAGAFGRPDVSVSEPWAVKGVAIRFARALASQDLAIFAVVLVAATILIAETAYLANRRRFAEFGVLRALGWPTREIALLVELEMLLLGAGVGLVAMVVAIGVRIVLGLELPLWLLGAIAPLSLAIAGIAGLGPAVSSSRASAARAIAPGPERTRTAGSIVGLALADLLGLRRTEALLGVATVGVGAALLGGVTLVAFSFAGQLDATLLGIHVAARAREFHVLAAVLTLVIGALAVAEIVTLGYLEREAEFGALRALGWPRRTVGTVVVVQAIAIGLAGGAFGAGAVAAAGWAVGVSPVAMGASLGLAVLSAVIATAVAAAAPLLHVYAADPAAALRGE